MQHGPLLTVLQVMGHRITSLIGKIRRADAGEGVLQHLAGWGRGGAQDGVTDARLSAKPTVRIRRPSRVTSTRWLGGSITVAIGIGARISMFFPSAIHPVADGGIRNLRCILAGDRTILKVAQSIAASADNIGHSRCSVEHPASARQPANRANPAGRSKPDFTDSCLEQLFDRGRDVGTRQANRDIGLQESTFRRKS